MENLIFITAIPILLFAFGYCVMGKKELYNTPNISAIVNNLLAIVVIYTCTRNMPYEYYLLAKFYLFVLFMANSFTFYYSSRFDAIILNCAIAVLYNPFIKFSFKKHDWNKIDNFIIAILIFALLAEIVLFFRLKIKSP